MAVKITYIIENSKLGKLGKWLQETKNANELGSIAGILGILSAIGNVIAVFVDYNSQKQSELSGWVYFFTVFCLISIIIWLLTKLYKYRKLQSVIKRTITDCYNHSIRTYRDLECRLDVELQQSELTLRHITDIVTADVRLILDDISKIFGLLTESDVCVCVKIFDNDFVDSESFSYKDATVVTMVRSSNTDEERIDNDNTDKPCYVYRNRDFQILCDENELTRPAIFYSPNLEKEPGYFNSTEGWDTYYKSTVVTAIRIANDKYAGNDKVTGYKIAGFLCADTLEYNVFEERQMRYIKAVMKSYAALLYMILHMYDDYIAILSNESDENYL